MAQETLQTESSDLHLDSEVPVVIEEGPELPQILNLDFVERFEKGIGANIGPRPLPLSYRLLRKIQFDDTDCWPVKGAKTKGGYAVIRVGSLKDQTRRQVLAHRASYEEWVGPIPDGLELLHSCDNRPCINPDHLLPGTAQENTQDMLTKGRSAKSPITGRFIGRRGL